MSYMSLIPLPSLINKRPFSIQLALPSPHHTPHFSASNEKTYLPINQQPNHTTTMEAIKNAIGLGSTTTSTTEQQGREPVNGVAGSGVAGEPYDQGNAEGMHTHEIGSQQRRYIVVVYGRTLTNNPDATLGGKAPQHTGENSCKQLRKSFGC